MADYDHARDAGLIVVLGKVAADRRLDAQRPKEVGRYRSVRDSTPFAAADEIEAPVHGTHRGHVGEAARFRPPEPVCEMGDFRDAKLILGIALPDYKQSPRARKGYASDERRVDDGEHCRDAADPERERQDCRSRQALRL
jgi:hypothetical protein